MPLSKIQAIGNQVVPNLGRRNIIVNGAMQVAQRGTSSTGIGASGGYFTCDRMFIDFSGTAGRLTQSQVAVTDLPGFANALKLDCTTADTSVAAGEIALLQYRIEGQDLQQFKKGTADAEKMTVSFYVKGNGNATYICELYDNTNARQISKTFSVTSSWTRVTLTYDGDTTGVFDDDNLLNCYILFWLHSGTNYNSGTLSTTWSSVTQANRAVGGSSFFSSTDNEFFITGLQMEVGDTATEFEHRSFAEELTLCQRYFVKYTGVSGINTMPNTVPTKAWNANSSSNGAVRGYVQFRAAPTITQSGLRLRSPSRGDFDGTFSFGSITVDGGNISVGSTSTSMTTHEQYYIAPTNTSSYLQLSAEL